MQPSADRSWIGATAVLLLLTLAHFAPALFGGQTLLSLDERAFPPFSLQADLDHDGAPDAEQLRHPQNLVTSDLQAWILSHDAVAAARLRRGELPLWDPTELLGRPLHADASFPTFYPPDWIHLGLDAVTAYAWSSAFHFFWAGLGMLLLLRRIGLRVGTALVGAAAFAFSGWMLTHLHIPHFVRTGSWLPWLLLATLRVVARPGAATAFGLAVVTAFATLASYPTVLGVMLFATALTALVVPLAQPPRPDDKSRLRQVLQAWGACAAAVATGLLIGAVALGPTAELRAASLRSENLTEEAARAKSLRPAHLVSLVAPDFQGNPVLLRELGIDRVEDFPVAHELFNAEVQDNYVEDTLYGGIPVLLLALVALTSLARRRTAHARLRATPVRLRAILAFGSLLLLALFVATSSPLQPLFRNLLIPGLGSGSPKRVLLLSAFALAGLAALGADLLFGERQAAPDPDAGAARRRFLAAGAGVAAACGVGWFVAMSQIAWWAGPDAPAERIAAARLALGLAFGVPAAFALATGAIVAAGTNPRWQRWQHWQRWPRVALFALLVGDLFLFGWTFNPFQPVAARGRPTPVIDFLQKPENAGRTLRYPTRELLPASIVSAWGVESVDGVQALLIREVAELLTALQPGVIDPANPNQVGSFDGRPSAGASPDPRFLALPLVDLLARWIVANQLLPPELGLELRYDGTPEGLGVFENRSALPKVFFADAVLVEGDKEARLRRLTAADFAPGRVALVESEEAIAGLAAATRAASHAAPSSAPPPVVLHFVRPRPERFELEVETPVAGVVVVNEAFFPGWVIEEAGTTRAPIRVDHAFLGIPLPAGRHALVLRYAPHSFQWSAVASVVGLLLLLALGLLALRRRHAPLPVPSPSSGPSR